MKDTESPLNTDKEKNLITEMECKEGVFYFTSGENPRKETSMCKTARELTRTILKIGLRQSWSSKGEVCPAKSAPGILKFLANSISIWKWRTYFETTNSNLREGASLPLFQVVSPPVQEK